MAGPMGFMASYINVAFKKDGQVIAEAQASLGCIRRGEPQDTLDLLRGATLNLKSQVEEGRAPREVLGYTSVVVGNAGAQQCEYTLDDIEKMKIRAARISNGKPGRKGPGL